MIVSLVGGISQVTLVILSGKPARDRTNRKPSLCPGNQRGNNVQRGCLDRRGLPDAETLQALAEKNLFRPDQSKWIEVSTDGEQMWVEMMD